MKRVLVVALVVAVLFTGIPVAVGMPAMHCADCDLGLLVAGTCLLAVLAVTLAAAVALRASRLRARPEVLAGLLAASGLDRPPRLA